VKYAVLVAALLGMIVLGRAARTRPALVWILAAAVGFLPFLDISVNVVSYESYRGDARGLEVQLFDLVAVALAVALPPAAHPSPFRGVRAAYITVAILSVFAAQNPLYASFTLWKLLRMDLLLRTVARGAESPRIAAAFVTGLCVAVTYEGLLALDQRYLMGFIRVQGTLSHPNSLGMAVNLIFPMAFALMLAGQGGRLAMATVASAAVAVIMSLSRGAMGMFVLAATIVALGSLARRPTTLKLKVIGTGVAAVVLVLLKSLDTIIERFTTAPASSEHARELFEAAAQAMLHDHPFGIGLNQFSMVLSQGYGANAGLPPGDQDGIVHNVYWLVTAESGYLGIATYLLFLAAPFALALRTAFSARKDIRGDLLLGAAAGLLVTYVQGKAEWIGRQTGMLALLAVMFGVIGALGNAVQREARARRV
jgi:hypothetical protein